MCWSIPPCILVFPQKLRSLICSQVSATCHACNIAVTYVYADEMHARNTYIVSGMTMSAALISCLHRLTHDVVCIHRWSPIPGQLTALADAADLHEGSVSASGLPRQMEGVVTGDRRSPILQHMGLDRRAWQVPAAKDRPQTPIFTV